MSTSWTLTLHLTGGTEGDPGGVLTSARAVLTTPDGTTLEGYGSAARNPRDSGVQQIGEEISTARALRDLADRLLQASSEHLSDVTHQPITLNH